jgi:oxygen-dependent protoporphyrinogen oxidase
MRIAIIGGGITGLTAAYALRNSGFQITLVERAPQLGGVIQTHVADGVVIEGGPDSFLAAKPAGFELLKELGLEDQVIASNDAQRVTYIVKHGKLTPMPDGLAMMVPTKMLPMAFTGILGWNTKVHMALEYFRKPKPRAEDVSVAQFIREHYGQETVDYLAEPLLAGVYGGDPEQLSMRSTLGRFLDLESRYGSLTRGTLEERKKAAHPAGALFRSLKGGMGQWIRALEQAIAGKVEILHAEAESVTRVGDAYEIKLGDAHLAAHAVVMATPAWQAARLLRPLDPDLAGELDAIPYNSSMTVALVYDRKQLKHPLKGFGFLVPKVERQMMAACTWVGTKFDHRAPKDKALLRCFVGGHANFVHSDAGIVEQVQADLRRLMGVETLPLFTRVTRWERSMAQYTVGHSDRVARIQEARAKWPGLYLAGNAYQGIGIPDCIQSARNAARAILAASQP